MKKALIAFLLVFASDVAFSQTSPVPDWSSYEPPIQSEDGRRLKIPTGKAKIAVGPRIDNSLVDFQFINANVGVAVGNNAVRGHYPIFYRTTDGGVNWSKNQLQVGWLPWSIAFRNEMEGFISTHDVTGCPYHCLQKNIVLRTSDGGRNWELIDNVDHKGVFQRIEFDSNGSAYGLLYYEEGAVETSSRTVANSILNTTDFGESWEVFYRPSQPNYNLGKFVLHDDLLFVPTENGSVIQFDDVGAVSAESATGYEHIHEILVADDESLFAKVTGGEDWSLVRSIDQGRTWTTVLNQLDSVVSVRSADDITVIVWKPPVSDVIQYIGAIALSTDGGESWTTSESIQRLSPSKMRQLGSQFDFLLLPDRIISIKYN